MIDVKEFAEAMHILGFYQIEDAYSMNRSVGKSKVSASAFLQGDSIVLKYWINGKKVNGSTEKSIEASMLAIETTLAQYGWTAFESAKTPCKRMVQNILAAINTQDLSSRLFRVKSSNVWAYRLFMKSRKDKTGDLIVQFKDRNGGPGDVYQYYDVPFTLFHKWQATTSKGHFFWKYIRNYYKYSKLTGDKRGKLANAVNNIVKKMPNIQFMLKYVGEFLDGSIDRAEFDTDLFEYWNMCNEDMAAEDSDFTRAFADDIIKITQQMKNHDDEQLRDVLSRNLRAVKRILT